MARRIPSLNWLRVFEAAARTGSFAMAARDLNMTAAAVSQQVRALEDHLDSTLFQRGAKSVMLTDAGRAFSPVVQNALRSVEVTADSLFGRRARDPLSVQTISLFALSWLAPRLATFRDRHPGIVLTLTTAEANSVFRSSSADLKIYFGDRPLMPDADVLQDEPLCGERLYPVAVPAIAHSIASADDLVHRPLIDVSTHRKGWLDVLMAAKIELDRDKADLIFVDNTAMAFAVARAGAGIALAREPVSDRLMHDFGLVPCLPRFPGIENDGYRLAHAGLERLTPAARIFRDWLIREMPTSGGLADDHASFGSGTPGSQA